MFRSDAAYISCVRLYTDGASRGNPGPAAVGVLIYDQNYAELERLGTIISPSTCNGAEYQALLTGLDLAAKYTRKKVECFLDSDVVEGQITGRYRLREAGLRKLYHQVKNFERPFGEVVYCQVTRTDQRLGIAHQLAHDALNGRAYAKSTQ